MDYTCIQVHGNLLSDELLHGIETDATLKGNREEDFPKFEDRLIDAINYRWSSLRSDWKHFYGSAPSAGDRYGTRRAREVIGRFLRDLGYNPVQQSAHLTRGNTTFSITYLDPELGQFPVIVEGDVILDAAGAEIRDRCSLDYRAKGALNRRSPHATMLEYLNATENVYGIVSNGTVLRLIRNSGQLVNRSYIEFDLRRMLEEDKYSEFCLLFRLLHASRFKTGGDAPCIFETWFERSVESGNRIRDGLSAAVCRAMELLANAALNAPENTALRTALDSGELTPEAFSHELFLLIYRLLFLFIIEDRRLVYRIPESPDDPDYARRCRWQQIYHANYAASRLRRLSEQRLLLQERETDLWQGLLETFRLFEPGGFGKPIGIVPLGGVLFGADTLRHLKACTIPNGVLLSAFEKLNQFRAPKSERPARINYASLNVEEFGSVYEGILEQRPILETDRRTGRRTFSFGSGSNRKDSSSYCTRPDLVQNLIRTALVPVIEARIAENPTPEKQIAALLRLRVCDAASGSGHVVLAMARTIAWHVCRLRTGEDNPASLEYREALREVIQKCVYAVDANPDAVELCKVVLWIEGYCAGKPLSFLDAHIRCGNSVLGVADLGKLCDGVPNEAFCATDRETLSRIRKLNKAALQELERLRGQRPAAADLAHAHQTDLFAAAPAAPNADLAAATQQRLAFDAGYVIRPTDGHLQALAQEMRAIAALPEGTLEEEAAKLSRWTAFRKSPRMQTLREACDLYTGAFYHMVTPHDLSPSVTADGTLTDLPLPYTRTVLQALEPLNAPGAAPGPLPAALPAALRTEARRLAARHRFFHWCLEFPEVFADGGFDVLCGNPPWDKIKVEEKKWFESHGNPDIAHAGNAADRKRKIGQLKSSDPDLYAEYRETVESADAYSRFLRFSGRFPLTAVGDIDLFPLFAELCLAFAKDAWGLVVPSGIATNESNKAFFAKLTDENRLISLFDFENREKLFNIDSRFRFCLLTAGKPQKEPRKVKAGFFLTSVDHLLDPNRIYTLRTEDFALLNPNTKTCPTFRTSRDAELTTKLYRRCKILVNEATGENPWKVKFGRMFDMSNDSRLFRTWAQLTAAGADYEAPNFRLGGETYVPLYEGKMIWHYNHHFGTVPEGTEDKLARQMPMPELEEFQNPDSCIRPWYWVPLSEVQKWLAKRHWKHPWFIGFRGITSATNERTFIPSAIPDAAGVGHSATLLFAERGAMPAMLLLGMLSSLPFDYVARQKIGGTNVSINFVVQFPVLTPEQIPAWAVPEIVARVAELTWFNHDLDGWMKDIWEDPEMTDALRTVLLQRAAASRGETAPAGQPAFAQMRPFRYDPGRRAVAQAELDALFARLYGLTEEELRYILDPEDVCGKGCINETFRVLRDNELRTFGEYRTKRLVLDAWSRLP